MRMDDQYLGDGVYAGWDGTHIILDVRSQPDIDDDGGGFCPDIKDNTRRIALDSDVFNNLIRFEIAVRREAKQESET